jgi:HAE1 family hydrophobic/amphiphilic exporter-1
MNVPLIDLNIGPQVRGAYQYLIQSLNSSDLYQGAEMLLTKLHKEKEFQSVSSDLEISTPQIHLDIHRNQAYALGVNVENFEGALQLGFSGNRISRIQTPISQYDVIVELDRNMQRTSDSLYSMYVQATPTNAFVPLSALSTWKEDVGPASVNHFAQFPAVTVSFNISPDLPLSQALAKLRQLAKASFGTNVEGVVVGAAQTFEESIKSVYFLLIVTIVVIYIVLGILYESYIHPLTILSTLPPAIVGALLTLYFTGRPLSLYAWLGIILLIGIVKKNGIMMVDFALENSRRKGENAETSIVEACIVRFRPIMMTTMAAIMGAFPIAFGIGTGAESRRPLGFVLIGGMVISQMITLFLTPVIYLYLEKLRQKVKQ